MATYKLYKKTSDTAKEEIQIPASSVSGLAKVATSGSYNDLIYKPQVPGVPDVVQSTGQSTSDVMSQKAVTDEIDKKANTSDIPTKVSQLTNDSNFATTSQVNAKYTKPSGGIPKSDLAEDVEVSLGKADTALQSAPVTSVNGKTGDVTLGAGDVGALPSSTKFVSSVNGKTGDVTGIATKDEVDAKIGNLSNPNLLINPNFAINQRGQSSYSGAVYGVDRWKGVDENVIATQVAKGIQVKGTVAYNTYIKQIVETNLADKTVTVSCKLSAINSGEGGRLAVYYSTDGTSWTLINGVTITTAGISTLTVTIPANAVYASVDLGVRPNSDVVFEWAKLEIGSVATEFSPPTIAEELLKCYRYYKKITSLQSVPYTAFGLVYGDGSGARMIVENTFRVNPTPTIAGALIVVVNGEYKTVSAIATQSFNSTNVVVKFTLSSGITEGLCGYLQSNNSPGAYIALDAEL